MPVSRSLPSVKTDGTSSAREHAQTINELRRAVLDIQDRLAWVAPPELPEGSKTGYPVLLGGNADTSAAATTGTVTPTANALVFVALAARATASLSGVSTVTDSLPTPLAWQKIRGATYDDGSGDRLLLDIYAARAGSAPIDMIIAGSVTGAAALIVAAIEIACDTAADLANTAADSEPDGSIQLALDSAPDDISTVIAFDCTLGAYSVRPPLGFTNAGEMVARGMTVGVAFKSQKVDQSFSWRASGMRATAVACEIKAPA